MLSVVLGRTAPVYHPDETITGDVVVNSTTQCTILDLTVNFCGISSISLIVSDGNEGIPSCQQIDETDMHLDVLDHLVRNYRGVAMEAGVNTFPFRLRLPLHLPSSHISPYGNINYYIHVHLQTSTTTLDVRKPFYIVAPVNINVFHAFQCPQSAEVVKKYGLLNKILKLKASVSSTCFVPGDLLSVVVEISNQSSKPLQYLFCTLKQITTIVVQLEDKVVTRVTKKCLQTKAEKVARNSRCHMWVSQLATPPSLTPTIANSSLILVTYSVQVSCKLDGVPIPPAVEIPIVFGVRAPVRPELTSVQNTPKESKRIRKISQVTPYGSVDGMPVVHSRRRRCNTQPSDALEPPGPMRRISHQIHNMPSHRISLILQPSFDDLESPELYQTEV